MAKIIAVYGSATVEPDHEHYQAAQTVGRALAQAGYSTMTGGYGGIMEAASRGAAEAGGHVIGVTCEQIELIRPRPANQWVREEVKYATLNERLNHLVQKADGYIVMPGGLGTLNELVLVWELMRVEEIPVAPILCFGKFWRATLSDFMSNPYLPARYHDLITFFDRPEQVITSLQNGRR